MAWPKGRSRSEYNRRAARPRAKSRKASAALHRNDPALAHAVEVMGEPQDALSRARIAVSEILGPGYTVVRHDELNRAIREGHDLRTTLATVLHHPTLDAIHKAVFR